MSTEQSVENIMCMWEKSKTRKKRVKNFVVLKQISKYKFGIGFFLAGVISYCLSLGIISIIEYIHF